MEITEREFCFVGLVDKLIKSCKAPFLTVSMKVEVLIFHTLL